MRWDEVWFFVWFLTEWEKVDEEWGNLERSGREWLGVWGYCGRWIEFGLREFELEGKQRWLQGGKREKEQVMAGGSGDDEVWDGEFSRRFWGFRVEVMSSFCRFVGWFLCYKDVSYSFYWVLRKKFVFWYWFGCLWLYLITSYLELICRSPNIYICTFC